MIRRARKGQWESILIIQTLHIPKAFPQLAKSFLTMLDEIPSGKRPAPLIPLIREEIWAKELLDRWEADTKSPITVIRAIKSTGSKK